MLLRLALIKHFCVPVETRAILRSSVEPFQHIFSCSYGWIFRLLSLFQACGQRLNNLFVIDREEKGHTVPSLFTPVDDAVDCRLVHVVCPSHHEIRDVDDEGIRNVGRNVPMTRRFEDLETRRCRRKQESETLIV